MCTGSGVTGGIEAVAGVLLSVSSSAIGEELAMKRLWRTRPYYTQFATSHESMRFVTG